MRFSKLPRAAIDLPARFRAAAVLCGGFVVAVPVVVLFGWALQIERLKRVLPGLVEMNPLTAVSFVLCGISLWVLLLRPLTRQARMVATTFSLLVVLMSLTRIVSLITSHDWAIDTVLF